MASSLTGRAQRARCVRPHTRCGHAHASDHPVSDRQRGDTFVRIDRAGLHEMLHWQPCVIRQHCMQKGMRIIIGVRGGDGVDRRQQLGSVLPTRLCERHRVARPPRLLPVDTTSVGIRESDDHHSRQRTAPSSHDTRCTQTRRNVEMAGISRSRREVRSVDNASRVDVPSGRRASATCCFSRSIHASRHGSCCHSGAPTARVFTAARRVSPTPSRWVRERIVTRTCIASVQ